MKFSIDMEEWPIAGLTEPEFVVVDGSSERRVYRVVEWHESRRTPKRLICVLDRVRLTLEMLGDSPVIHCTRYKRKRKRKR